jgi:hypothetical protein
MMDGPDKHHQPNDHSLYHITPKAVEPHSGGDCMAGSQVVREASQQLEGSQFESRVTWENSVGE